jgi:hypothetical protein
LAALSEGDDLAISDFKKRLNDFAQQVASSLGSGKAATVNPRKNITKSNATVS